jgi:hypothetical protein
MTYKPADPFPKSRGDAIRSTDFNEAVIELQRLDTAKVNKAGDNTITGSLTINGNVGIGTSSSEIGRLTIEDDAVPLSLRESGQSPTAGGLWRMPLDGGVLRVDVNSAAAGDFSSFATPLAMTAAGHLGIGTTQPENAEGFSRVMDVLGGPHAKLSVRTASIDARMMAHSGNIWGAPAGMVIGTHTGHALSFGTNRSSRMTIDHLGQVGIGTSPASPGKLRVEGSSVGTTEETLGILAIARGTSTGAKTGVRATASGAGVKIGGHFTAASTGDELTTGIRGEATGDGIGNHYGVYGTAGGNGTTFAGMFDGAVHVAGVFTCSDKHFLIDHPLDPENKTLRHSSVESPENICLYRGKARLDGDGKATVRMPEYFAALTREDEATVYLTPIGEDPSPASYQWEDAHTEFTVHGPPGGVVAYLVLAERDYPYIRSSLRPVEEEKGVGNFEKGKLLDPEALGKPAEMGIAAQPLLDVLQAEPASPEAAQSQPTAPEMPAETESEGRAAQGRPGEGNAGARSGRSRRRGRSSKDEG